MLGYVGRSLTWLVVSSALLVGGFLLLCVALVASKTIPAGIELTSAQLTAGRLLVQFIVIQALLPHLLLTFAGWLVLAGIAPFLEGSWRRLLAGLPALAVLCFPLVGEFSFHIWNPTGPGDYISTLLLMSGGVSIALLLPRRVIRPLRPGSFALPRASRRPS